MALLDFRRKAGPNARTGPSRDGLAEFVGGYSIEVMPRTVAQVEDLRALLPAGTRIYIAHIDGTPITDMVATAARLATDGFEVMPHLPARIIPDQRTLADWIARYQGEAGVTQALLLAGGVARPRGAFASSMDLIGTGLFDRAGFTRLHVAGHPEGNRDIDPAGGMANVEAALRWKSDFARRTEAKVALVTQFAFDAAPLISWVDDLVTMGIDLPVHIGIAGPAKLQTMIRFAIACGVGPSLRVLQRRARDVTKLLVPHEPTDILTALARHKAAHPGFGIEQVHFFPLGGIEATARWARAQGGAAGLPAASTARG